MNVKFQLLPGASRLLVIFSPCLPGPQICLASPHSGASQSLVKNPYLYPYLSVSHLWFCWIYFSDWIPTDTMGSQGWEVQRRAQTMTMSHLINSSLSLSFFSLSLSLSISQLCFPLCVVASFCSFCTLVLPMWWGRWPLNPRFTSSQSNQAERDFFLSHREGVLTGPHFGSITFARILC